MEVLDMGFWTAAVVAAMLVGLSKGGLPAVGMLAVPVMALVMNPIVAAGLLLPVYVVSDMFGLWAYRREFDRRLIILMVPPAIIGIAIGWATASIVSERIVTGIIGLIGLSFALNLLLRKGGDRPAVPVHKGKAWFWLGVTGFTTFISHAGAPPYQIFVLPLRLSKAVFAGTTTVLFAILNAVKLIPYWQLGQLSPGNLKVAALLFLPAIIAVFAGVRLVRILPTGLFFKIVTWALLLVSVKLLADAIF